METERPLARGGAIAAFGGPAVLLVSTLVHPMEADPNDAEAAFAEYAADELWLWSHLGQFVGVVMLGVALVALAGRLETGRPAAWARIGSVGVAATIAVAAVLQAVDGVALKLAVDRWAVATEEARALAFEAALAVRQVEIGLAALLSIVFGATSGAFGAAIAASARFPLWMGVLGLLAATASVATGMAQAATGFSGLSMALGMLSIFILLPWFVAIGRFLWRPDSQP